MGIDRSSDDQLTARVGAERDALLSNANRLIGPTGEPPTSRRLRIYAFTPGMLVTLGMHRGLLVTGNPTIPAGARPCGVAYDFARDLFLVRMESPEFEEVPEGQPIPFGEGPLFRTIDDRRRAEGR